MVWCVDISSSTEPSGGDFATWSEPIVPLAPGLASTMTGMPKRSWKRSAISRAKMSVAPPAETASRCECAPSGTFPPHLRTVQPTWRPRVQTAGAGAFSSSRIRFRRDALWKVRAGQTTSLCVWSRSGHILREPFDAGVGHPMFRRLSWKPTKFSISAGIKRRAASSPRLEAYGSLCIGGIPDDSFTTR